MASTFQIMGCLAPHVTMIKVPYVSFGGSLEEGNPQFLVAC
jgi:hypothetical protein